MRVRGGAKSRLSRRAACATGAGMQDRPNAAELLEAVRGFLEKDVLPALEGTAKFHARVAANVLAIVGRELALEPGHLAAEWERLDGLLGPEAMPADPAALRAA